MLRKDGSKPASGDDVIKIDLLSRPSSTVSPRTKKIKVSVRLVKPRPKPDWSPLYRLWRAFDWVVEGDPDLVDSADPPPPDDAPPPPMGTLLDEIIELNQQIGYRYGRFGKSPTTEQAARLAELHKLFLASVKSSA